VLPPAMEALGSQAPATRPAKGVPLPVEPVAWLLCPSLGELRRRGRRAMYLRPCLGERRCWGSRAMPPRPCLGELRRRPAAHPRNPSAGLPATRTEKTRRCPHPGARDWICRLPAPEVLVRTDSAAPRRPSRTARRRQRRNTRRRETGSGRIGDWGWDELGIGENCGEFFAKCQGGEAAGSHFFWLPLSHSAPVTAKKGASSPKPF
jgi:hypothetical protein